MSVGNGDMSIPSVYHYMPHLIGKPSSLKPAVKLSRGRAGGEYILEHLLQFTFFIPVILIFYVLQCYIL